MGLVLTPCGMGKQGTGRNSAHTGTEDKIGGAGVVVRWALLSWGSICKCLYPEYPYQSNSCRQVFRQFGEGDTKWPTLKLHLTASGLAQAWKLLLMPPSCGLEQRAASLDQFSQL